VEPNRLTTIRARLGGQWGRLPVLVRAIVGGFCVFVALQFGWNVLAMANMVSTPAIPWSAPLALLYLWVVFRYFSGKWGRPAATAAAREEAMGARPLSGTEWIAALAASLVVMIFIIATTILSYRLIEVPSDGAMLPDMPWWSLYTALLMISIVAGVSEEAGFRGYMQGRLERRYGPVVAISVTALMFWVAHFNHASGVARFTALFLMGASLGTLSYCARSILPAIVTHATTDSIIFIGSASGIGPAYFWNPVPLVESGVDAFFWVLIAVIVSSSIVGAVTLRRLRRATHLGLAAHEGPG